MDEVINFRKMFDYDYWANSETLASLRSMPGGDDKARKALNHVIGAQRVWIARFESPSPPSARPWPELTLAESASAIEELRAWWKNFFDHLTPEKLKGDLVYRTLSGSEYKTPIQDVLMHLVVHSAYHRGQVAATVREAGGKPTTTDYVVFVRLKKGQ